MVYFDARMSLGEVGLQVSQNYRPSEEVEVLVRRIWYRDTEVFVGYGAS
jgi:hypothetical protein